MLKDHKALNEIISLSALISTFLHNNNYDGLVREYSVLAHILEDKNKHAILFDNTGLMAEISQLVTSHLTAFVSSSQESNEQLPSDYIVCSENTPERFMITQF